MSTSYTVDLDLYSGPTLVRSIVKKLPDFSSYSWFIPDASFATATIRATFKNESGATVGTVDSGTFSIAWDTSAPPPSGSDAAALHDFDGDAKTEITVFRPVSGQ